MPKLTDTQLVILSAAAQRDDGALLPTPKGLEIEPRSVTRVFGGLLKKGLAAEQPAPPDGPAWRETGNGQRFMPVISPAGLDAIGVEPEGGAPATGKGGKSRPTAGKPKRKPAGRKPKNAPPPVRPGTKQALLINLLKRKRGATIAEIVEATGWQPHSVRGAISGALKKKLGLTVTSEPTGKRGRVYRIVGRG
jgi:hypothetical protein